MLDVPSIWRAILAVDEERQFSRAATTLGMTQPQLSRLIARAEHRLEVRIFDRRPLTRPTPSGQVVIAALRSAIAELREAEERAKRIAAGAIGQVKIGFASSVATTSFPRRLQRFASAFPDVIVTLKEMHSSEQVSAIREGAIDLAIGRERPNSADVRSELLIEDRLVCAVASSHRLAATPAVELADLATEVFVLFERSCTPSLHDLIMRFCGSAGFRPRISHSAREWHTILALVAAEYGVALVPASLRELSWPNLVFRELRCDQPMLPVYLLWPRAGLTPAAVAALEHIQRAVD